MEDKVVKTARKPSKNAGIRSARLGPMQTARKREIEPSYVRLLHRFRFIDRKNTLNLMTAFDVWQRVCVDPEVMRLSMTLASKRSPYPSIAAPYQNGAKVLAAMSEKQILALKERIGVS